MDRCNNLSTMADGFRKPKMVKYVKQTEQYVLPLLDVVREVPAWNNAAWLTSVHITQKGNRVVCLSIKPKEYRARGAHYKAHLASNKKLFRRLRAKEECL